MYMIRAYVLADNWAPNNIKVEFSCRLWTQVYKWNRDDHNKGVTVRMHLFCTIVIEPGCTATITESVGTYMTIL